MSKLLLLLSLLCVTTLLSAQQVYNGSFETWYSPTNPDGWGTWALTISQFNGAFGDSLVRLAARDSVEHANYPNDTVSLRLTVDTATLPGQYQVTLAGFASLGGASYTPPPLGTGLEFGYYPYIDRPDSLIFDYKYIPAAGYTDSALVVMTMERFDSASQIELYYIAESWLLDTTSQWTHVALHLDYLSGDTFTLNPDSIQIYFIASVAANKHRGTTLWIDTVHFDASVNPIDTPPTGISDIKNIKRISTYPNPADNEFHIVVPQTEIGSTTRLFDPDGKVVYQGNILSTDQIIDTRRLAPAIYSLEIRSIDHLTVYHGLATVVHDR
jgi:hypothetical protein